MLGILLAKDLRRARRNPLPWLINLAIPLAITALIGLTFGGGGAALGRIRLGVVDQDDTPLTRMLRGMSQQGRAGNHLEPLFLDRAAAERELLANKLAAVLVIPTNFTRGYLSGSQRVSLELIKNPAQSVHPTVLEELLEVVVTALSALARNFGSEFPAWQAVFEGQADYRQVAALIERAGEKLQAARAYVNPPLVTYSKQPPEPVSWPATARESPARPAKPGRADGFNLFGYLLAGMTGMFLLFIAGNSLNDLHREVRLHTFERYHTLRHSLLPFVAGKVALATVLLLAGSAVLLGGGALVFRIPWQHPLALAALSVGYAGFAASFMAVLGALTGDERVGNTVNTLVAMALAVAGGCAFPPQQLPALLRQHISPLLPTYWFAETVRRLEYGGGDAPWVQVTLQLAILSLALLAVAALLFRRRFRKGLRA